MKKEWRKWLVLLAAVVLVTGMMTRSAAAADVATGGLRYTIQVADFENQPNVKYASWWGSVEEVDDRWSTIMTDVLQKTGRFVVIAEKGMRQAAMDEQDFANSGRAARGAKTPVTGQMSTAQLILKGRITNVQETSNGGGAARIGNVGVGGSGSSKQINMTFYIVDTSTGQLVASTSIVATAKSGSTGLILPIFGGVALGSKNSDNTVSVLEDAASKAAKWMIEQLPKMPWRGEVAQIAGDNVYINRGAREGVKVGQVFEVGTPDIIRDPSTGEVLDENLQPVGQLKVVSVRDKLSVCQLVSGEGVEKNMLIRPLQ